MTGQERQLQPAERQGAALRTARLEVGLRSDRGASRDLNEDCAEYLIPTDEAQLRSKGALFVVADGMGGYLAGEVASEEAVRKVIKEYYADRSDDPGKSLRRAVIAANKVVHQQASADPAKSGMGTTLVAAAVIGSRVYIANVGDSRAYGIGRDKTIQITQDHSWVAEQIDAGILTREAAQQHPQRNLITRALGRRESVEIDLFEGQLLPGAALLLCTDGVCGPLSDEQMARAIRPLPPKQAAERLVEEAAATGGTDNASALIVRAVATDRDSGPQVKPSPRQGRKGQPEGVPSRRGMAELSRQPWVLGAVAVALILCVLAAVIFVPALTQKLAGDPVAAPLPAPLQDGRLAGAKPDQVALYLGYADAAQMSAAHGGLVAPEALGASELTPAAAGVLLVGTARDWSCEQQRCGFRLEMADVEYSVAYQAPGEVGVDLSGHPVRVYGPQQEDQPAVAAQLIERGSHWWAWWQPAWTLVHQTGSREQSVWVYSIVDRNPNGLIGPDQGAGLQRGSRVLLHGIWAIEDQTMAFEEDEIYTLQGSIYVPATGQPSLPLPTVTLQPTPTTKLPIVLAPSQPVQESE